MKLRMLKSRNLMPSFLIYLLKSRKYNPVKYALLTYGNMPV